ncbi:(+)-neomenthol dehydrogenase-like isoform X4 [Asparagus officinalis]|uniref:(+)-neomenthol dehydrogenase-like isoform X4 n=1 Tax=Asparagus officinalis TaxID=4686 RepID=UPI00098E2839|nr:(+)-neomenthol dehydrogenase-like isoform X4 [Asparagus officinalis]
MEEPFSKGSTKRTAVVTGANKGIGLEICRQLSSRGVLVVLTARDERRGTEAVEELRSSGLSDVLFHQLDVADPSSVSSLANFVKTQFGKLDILVNNAGVSGLEVNPQEVASLEEKDNQSRANKIAELARETHETALECLNANYYGVKRVTEALLPLLELADSPNIVIVSSTLGQLKNIPSEIIRKQMGTVDEQTEERLDELLQSFLKDLKEQKLEENGWPTNLSAYKVSKAAVSTYTRVLAAKHPKFRINCVCPGFVKTDINFNSGILSVEEGAKGPVKLALLPADGSPTGLFYQQTNLSTFE